MVETGEEGPVFDASAVREAEDLRGLSRRGDMDAVCEECGDAGFRKLLLRCSKCKNSARHRYCLDTVIFDLVGEWSCSGCIPKHNEAIKSLEDASNQSQLSSIQSGSSMVNGPTVDMEKITKSWGLRAIRSRRKRKDCVGGSTKQFPSGDTSNWGQGRNEPHKERRDSSDAITTQFCSGDALYPCFVFVGDIPKNNDYEKEGEDRNGHLTCAVESFDSSSNLPLDYASEFEPNNLQMAMDGSKLASNFTECTDLSNASSCFASSKYVEGLVPRGRKGDTFYLTNDVEGSLPMIVDKPCPTSTSVEQASLSTNRDKSEPLNAVTGLENHSKPTQRSDLTTRSADVLNPPKQSLDSWSMVPMQSSPSNELEDVAVQENSAERMIMDKSRPTSARVEQAGLSIEREKSEPVKAVTALENSAVVSQFAPNHSKLIQGSDLKTGSADVLNPPKESLDLLSMVAMQLSQSNELEDVAAQENSAERTRCLVDEETNAPTIGNLNISKPSMENECVPSNEGNLDKANRKSDEVLLSTKAKKITMRVSGDREIVNSYKVTGISNPESAKGNRDARNLKRNARKPSSLGVKNVLLKQVSQEEGINSELLSARFFGPCESTKIRPRKRKQSGSYTPDGTRHQKAITINEIKIVNDAQSKGGRPASAASVRDGQNMSREGNGSNDKVIGHSKKRKYKTMDNLLLANNASRDSRKRRGMVTSVLKPSSLHRTSVDKSRPCSENMDLPLKESIWPLNHRCSKNHKEVRKNRSMDANKDVIASARNLDAGCAESDVSQLALETVVKDISRMPPMQPLDNPYWTGIMKIDGNYIPLAAHLSTEAGKKVQEQSRSLPPILEVTELSTSKTCPKRLEAPIPSADSIGLYFFATDMRPNNELDQLVKHVADSGIVLEAIVGLSKLFLFASFVLPEGYQRFQGKPFLWGVFKPREEKIKRLAPVEQDRAAHITKEDHAQEQHVLDQQDQMQGNTLDQVVHPEKQALLDTNQVAGKETFSGNGLPLVDMKAIVSANISPADQGQPCSNLEAPPPKLCGIVVSQTPRSAQLIQEPRLQTPAEKPYPQRVLSPFAMAATLFSTALSHHFIPLTSAKPSATAAASFACGPLRAVSALLAPRRRLLLPVAVAEVTSDLETEEVEEDGEGGGDSEAEYSEDLKVFVGNLPFTVDSEQLAGLFEQAGSVEMVEVIYDRMTGRSRGFGFVTMSSVEEVKAAVEQFNGYTFQGRPLRVNSGPPPPRDEFAPRTPRTFGAGGGGGGGNFDSGNKLYVGNLSWGVDNSTLENLFSEQGQVLDAKVIYDRDSGRSRGFGFVTYGSAEEVNKAISKLDGVDLDGRQIRVTVAESKPREQRPRY